MRYASIALALTILSATFAFHFAAPTGGSLFI